MLFKPIFPRPLLIRNLTLLSGEVGDVGGDDLLHLLLDLLGQDVTRELFQETRVGGLELLSAGRGQ